MLNCCKTQKVLKVADVIVAFTFVSHLTITVWTGIWILLDVYVIPSNLILSSLATVLLGTVICGTGCSVMPLCQKYVSKNNKILLFIVYQLVNNLMTVGTVALWRGVWNLEDLYLGTEGWSSVVSLLVSFLIMCVLRISCNCVAAPLVITFDYDSDIFDVQGRLGIKSSRPVLFVLDQFLTKLLVESLVVSVWRPIWNIQDKMLLPDHHLVSNVVSWIIGNLLCLFLIPIQRHVGLLSEKYGTEEKLIVEDIYVFFATIGTVFTWRGYWTILEVDLLPDPMVGGWLCLLVGSLILMVMGTSTSSYSPTCIIDGEMSEDGIYWTLRYLQAIFQERYDQVNTDPDKKSETPADKLLQIECTELNGSPTVCLNGSIAIDCNGTIVKEGRLTAKTSDV